MHSLLAFALLPSAPPPRFAAAVSVGRAALRMATSVNPSIAGATACDFPWWSDECGALIADLDSRGGERFVASHDDEGYDTRNWLHVRAAAAAALKSTHHAAASRPTDPRPPTLAQRPSPTEPFLPRAHCASV